jgi:hypothetical protein
LITSIIRRPPCREFIMRHAGGGQAPTLPPPRPRHLRQGSQTRRADRLVASKANTECACRDSRQRRSDLLEHAAEAIQFRDRALSLNRGLEFVDHVGGAVDGNRLTVSDRLTQLVVLIFERLFVSSEFRHSHTYLHGVMYWSSMRP